MITSIYSAVTILYLAPPSFAYIITFYILMFLLAVFTTLSQTIFTTVPYTKNGPAYIC